MLIIRILFDDNILEPRSKRNWNIINILLKLALQKDLNLDFNINTKYMLDLT